MSKLRNGKVLFALAIPTALAVTAAFAATEVARVNGKAISAEYFTRKYNESLQYFQHRRPSKKDVMDDLVKRELAIQEARKLKLDKDPDVIDRMETVLYHALVEKKLSSQFEKIHVTDKEAKDFYEKNPEIRTSHIFVALAQNASAKDIKEAEARLKEIRDKHLRSGKMGFAEAAQRFSEGMYAPMGGDLDYKTKDQLDPAYYQAAVALKRPGAMTDIVRSSAGLHLIKLTAIRPWVETDQPKVKRLVFEERRQEIFDRYMTSLKSGAKIQVNQAFLKD